MRLEIAELHQRLKTTMIYVTHDQVEAMTMADKIVVLQRRATSSRSAAPLELYHRPANLFVAGFIGTPKMNFMAGEGQGHTTPTRSASGRSISILHRRRAPGAGRSALPSISAPTPSCTWRWTASAR